MTDSIATAAGAADDATGEKTVSRLAVRIASMAPPPLNLTTEQEQMSPTPQPAPEAAAEAPSTRAAIVARADQRARRSRSIIGLTVDSFVAACSFIPYALVAIVLRLVMARLFFLDGQTRIEGPRVPLNVQDFDFSVVLPLQVKVETFGAFLNQYAAVPVSPVVGAYLLSYAEFILPICLLLGFATRFAALGMLIITALIQIYVAPDALWSVHVFWAAILLVLLSRGPGPISVDAIIRYIARR
ncbi:MAG: DoxX family protein [Rhizobiales bacterium]|nr:DoxX family protein [Hyphomicrobiales bacterium]